MQHIWQIESPVAKVRFVQATEGLRASSPHMVKRGRQSSSNPMVKLVPGIVLSPCLTLKEARRGISPLAAKVTFEGGW